MLHTDCYNVLGQKRQRSSDNKSSIKKGEALESVLLPQPTSSTMQAGRDG